MEVTVKVRSHGAATVAATVRKCCHYNWIPLYLMHLFTLCGSSSSCGNGNASKWVLTLFLQLRQWQTNTVVRVICHCCKCLCEHFHVIAVEKPLPLPYRVNGPLNISTQFEPEPVSVGIMLYFPVIIDIQNGLLYVYIKDWLILEGSVFELESLPSPTPAVPAPTNIWFPDSTASCTEMSYLPIKFINLRNQFACPRRTKQFPKEQSNR